MWGSDPCFSSTTCQGQVHSYQLYCFSPSSFILPSFAWFLIFFSAGQVPLSALSWCSACTSVSEGVLLMYPQRERERGTPRPPNHPPSCSLSQIDAFELWCWRRLMRVPWTARRSNQYILKAINPEYLLEGLMLKLKHQYFGHLMGRTE